MPSVQVRTLKKTPDGFDHYTFPSSLCARFRFVGPRHNGDFDMLAIGNMYKAIYDFMDDDEQKYFLDFERINIDRLDLAASDGPYDYWEWFAPVRKKTPDDVPEYKPGIIKTYKQEIPALRFIGKNTRSLIFHIRQLLVTWTTGVFIICLM